MLEVPLTSLEEIEAIENLCVAIDTAMQDQQTTFHFCHNYIVRGIPEDIKLLRRYLQILHIDHCYELKALPSALGELVNLRWLNVSYNKLEMLPPEIGKLRFMERLHINNNHLSFLPTELWNLKALQELRCDSNQLKGLPTGVLTMNGLEQAYLNNNAFLTKEDVADTQDLGIDTVVPPLSGSGGDCSNCRGRILKGLTHITFHEVCGTPSVPIIHYCCSARCLDLLRRCVVSTS